MKKVLLSLLLAIACMPMAIGQNKAGNLVTIDTTVCSSFTWMDNVTYTHDTVVLYSPAGDSNTYVLNLTMSTPVYDTNAAIQLSGICNVKWGRSANDTAIFTTSGTFLDTLSTVDGCDSIVKLQVTLTGASYDTIEAVACDKYVYDAVEYTTSGTFDVTKTVDGCESNTHLVLTIVPSLTDTSDVVVREIVGGCNITWNDSTYTFGDTNRVIYAMGTTAVGACDSLMAIRITSFSGTQYDTIKVENCGRYQWNVTNQYYYNDTIVSVTDTTDATCTRVQTLSLNIVPNFRETNVTSCETYTFYFDNRAGQGMAQDHATFTESGVYVTDENGDTLYSTHRTSKCVTYHTLNLTILTPAQRINNTTVYDTVCDKYSITFGSNTNTFEFTESVDTTLIYSRRTALNCYDTTIHLNIVVNHRSFVEYNETVCDSYFWPFTNETYYTSTVKNYTLPDVKNAVNCDSVGQLNLTVHNTPAVTIEGNWHLHPDVSNTAVLTIVSDPTENNTYKWFKNNETTPFSTADSVSVTVNANTDIRLETTGHFADNHVCVANNWITISYNLGIDNVDGLNVNLYPNPTSRFLNVESAEGISEVVVYNAIGQQVIRRDVNASATQLDLGNLAIGNYTLQIRSANGEQTTRKFIVNK